jgi:hypothetical protein
MRCDAILSRRRPRHGVAKDRAGHDGTLEGPRGNRHRSLGPGPEAVPPPR